MKQTILISLILFCLTKLGIAQNSSNNKAVNANDTITREAHFPGGSDSLNHYVDKNIIYPEEDLSRGIEGMAHVAFTVNENGSITGIHALSSYTSDKYMDSAAVRCVRKMPNWIPAMKHGKPISSMTFLPMHFKVINR